jgi:hypothetical protein
MGMENDMATAENSMAVLQKIKTRIVIRSSNSTSGPKEMQARIYKRYLYTHVPK